MTPVQIISICIGFIMILPSTYVFCRYRTINIGGIVLVVLGFLLVGIQSMGKIDISIGTAGIKATIDKLQSEIKTVSLRQDALFDSQKEFQERLAVQVKLSELGIYKGPIDGIQSPSFVSAIENYQKNKELIPSGKIDKKTLEALSLPQIKDLSKENVLEKTKIGPFNQ